jgi:cadmium resistance protein CadD (predicted permease)
MQFGKALGTACSTFVITNIDDLFVLVTFFAEAASGKNTALKITIGQYLGFTVIIAVSMIGFAVALVLPPEPIGFLGLLPLLLGVWKFLELVLPYKEDTEGDEAEEAQTSRSTAIKAILSVALITIMNGGDNIGTYIPLFSQAKGAEIAVYVVTYYILLGVWCLAAFLIMKQKHILALAEKYASYVIPFLYVGLGIFIVVKSDCYPWTVDKIDDTVNTSPGKVCMGVSTAALLSSCVGCMLWLRLRKRATEQHDSRAVQIDQPDSEAPDKTNQDHSRYSADHMLQEGNRNGDLSRIEAFRSGVNHDTARKQDNGKEFEGASSKSSKSDPIA